MIINKISSAKDDIFDNPNQKGNPDVCMDEELLN
jgi:hypothetical protein